MGEGGQTNRQTNNQTEGHINNITRPGLGAGPSENIEVWHFKQMFVIDKSLDCILFQNQEGSQLIYFKA